MHHSASYNGSHVTGFGQAEVAAPTVVAATPLKFMLAASAMAAATGWVLEEFSRAVRSRKRKRRR